MVDKEKVFRGLKHCTTCLGCFECPYSVADKCTVECKLFVDRDALELIKMQERQIKKLQKEKDEVIKLLKSPMPEDTEVELEGGGTTWWYVCGECHGAIDSKDKFCRYCGRLLKWGEI